MTDIIKKNPKSKSVEAEGELVETGQWYWVETEDGRELGCVIHVGSNYTKIKFKDQNTARVHDDEFDDVCTLEPEPDKVINALVQEKQEEVQRLMGEVQEAMAQLAMGNDQSGEETQALATIHSNQTYEGYKGALVKAQQETLPELFKQMEEANTEMASWMRAKIIPFQARTQGMKTLIKKVEGRIFNVELYAGLTEDVVQVLDGKPAKATEKISLFQRRCYMDEECLAQYEVGGMEFKDIPDFDAWMAQPDNLNRILPHQRCVVAFQVRRYTKEREIPTDLITLLSKARAEKLDQLTFLYIRNGEQLFRLQTELDFGEKLFPDMDRSRLENGKVYAKVWGDDDDVQEIISENEYLGMVETHTQEVLQWKKDLAAYRAALKSPEAKARAKEDGRKRPDARDVDLPYVSTSEPYSEHTRYERYDSSTVHYDDITNEIQSEIEHHNRIALILQGLLDRSPVFHPHPQWQIGTPEGLVNALNLVYDDSRSLTTGDKPDIQDYLHNLNDQIERGSITIGQAELWKEAEADKRDQGRLNRYYYNEGVPHMAQIQSLGKKGALFSWERESYTGKKIRVTFTCPVEELFNVSAYKPGDFKKFFDDPRTRADYLEWAPLFLEAEEYHAGNREVAEPIKAKPRGATSYEAKIRYAQQKRRKALVGKTVQLNEDMRTVEGTVYKAGSLWKVVAGSGHTFSIRQIIEGDIWGGDRVGKVYSTDFTVVEGKEE